MYQESVKNFNKIREYIREFFINGFKSRQDSTLKEPFYDTPVLCENQQYADVSPQSVYILIGR